MSNINNREDRMAFLANSIAKSKVVMDKVESNNFSRGHIDREALQNAPDPVNKLGESYQQPSIQHDDRDDEQEYNDLTGQPNNMEKNLSNSKMPSSILESFAKNPGTFKSINTSNPLSSNNSQMADLANKVPGTKRSYSPPPASRPQFNQQPQYSQPAAQPLSEDYIKFIINKTIEETVEKTVKVMLEQQNKPTSLDENIQIKIGSKTFGGKIKTLKA